MSALFLKVDAYDVMDQVQVVLRVAEQEPGRLEPLEWETLVARRFQGTGETDRREWVQDALVAVLEGL